MYLKTGESRHGKEGKSDTCHNQQVHIRASRKQKKRKVAAYARVSTEKDEQQTSYEAQVDYYTNYINGRDDWEFVSVYADEVSVAALQATD